MTDKIQKFINSLDAKRRFQLKQKLLDLKQSPFHGPHIKKLKGDFGACWRLRLGNIRIIYRVDAGQIEIVDIDYRGNIY